MGTKIASSFLGHYISFLARWCQEEELHFLKKVRDRQALVEGCNKLPSEHFVFALVFVCSAVCYIWIPDLFRNIEPQGQLIHLQNFAYFVHNV